MFISLGFSNGTLHSAIYDITGGGGCTLDPPLKLTVSVLGNTSELLYILLCIVIEKLHLSYEGEKFCGFFGNAKVFPVHENLYISKRFCLANPQQAFPPNMSDPNKLQNFSPNISVMVYSI